jgi:ceramide glucosyltransferase
MIRILDTGLIVIMLFGVIAFLACMAAVLWKLARARKPTGGEPFHPPVTILKPLKGLDAQLYENLLSFVRQDYPEFQIVFGLQSPDDPALAVLRRLEKEYPRRDMRIVISDFSIGYNPKVNNLAAMWPAAKYEHMVISDSNVRVRPDYLRRNVSHLRNPAVGLVTNLVRGIGGRSAPALLEALHLNSFVMGTVSLADVLGDQQLVVGKSIFFRRSDMAAIGGIERFRNYLAEDYLIGKVYLDHGHTVIVSGDAVDTWTDRWTFRKFINRHTRWAKLRWNLNHGAYVGELLMNFCAWSLLFAAVNGFAPFALRVAGSLSALKITGDYLLNRALGCPLPAYAFLLSPFKELIVGAVWPVPLCWSRTQWRGKPLKVGRGSLLMPVN